MLVVLVTLALGIGANFDDVFGAECDIRPAVAAARIETALRTRVAHGDRRASTNASRFDVRTNG
jgi:hypothetical protein